MHLANFCVLSLFFQDNRLIPLKASLKKMLAVFVCLLLINATTSCWQQVNAQSQQQSYSSMSFPICHQAVASAKSHDGSMPHHRLKKHSLDQQGASAESSSVGSHHQCALNCSLYTSPIDVSQHAARIANPLLASKSFYLIITPLQAWVRDLERPPQFLN